MFAVVIKKTVERGEDRKEREGRVEYKLEHGKLKNNTVTSLTKNIFLIN